MTEKKIFDINYKYQNVSHCQSEYERNKLYNESINDVNFWGKMGKKYITWDKEFTQTQYGSFINGDIAWFLNGKLNVCYNCVDRWLINKSDKIALIYEGDNPKNVIKYTYKDLFYNVCKFANVLKNNGIKRGDIVIIYMGMIPQLLFSMLACARIGAIHSVIFGGFGPECIKQRINDTNAKYVITCNEQQRSGKYINLKSIVDEGIKDCKCVTKVFVYFHDYTVKYNENNINMVMNRDYNVNKLLLNVRGYCKYEIMDSEDILFLLYTSGSTGKPKGIVHSQAGYLLYAILTCKYVFDLHENDVYACVADLGWITGHSYILYGPLGNGASTFLFESTPLYPNPGRYWDMVQRHRITQLYTSPTAIRALQTHGNNIVNKYDLSSLRILGTVGEPINPKAWLWFYSVVGKNKCPIVDTYWQTETGGILLTPLPGSTKLIPGSATKPFFGIQPCLLDKNGDEILQNGNNIVEGKLVFKKPWPGIGRTVYNNHKRYLTSYMKLFNGYYYTSDAAKRDINGNYYILGRIDDVINVSGHRIGTAEIESCVTNNKYIVECACVGIEDDITGQAIFVYAVKGGNITDDVTDNVLKYEINQDIRNKLGKFYKAKYIIITNGLPKTRSGKIMRRILRKIASSQYDKIGDITTLSDPSVIKNLIQKRKQMKLKGKL